jgi:hypothetical protein
VSADALWTLLGDQRAAATELARGPWDPGSLHGGPVSALLARAVERHPADGVDWFVARLTVELERPVPLDPVAWTVTTTRPGRKVSLVEATLTLADTDRVLARARALRIRRAPVPLPHDDAAKAPHLVLPGPPPGPEESTRERSTTTIYEGFHNVACEHRFAEGGWAEPGATIGWIRLLVPVIAGEAPLPLQRVVAAADFANGISHALSFDTHTFINPDLTVHVFRPLEGEWVGLASRSLYGDDGVGLSDTALYDTRGRVGRSNQSLFLDRQ